MISDADVDRFNHQGYLVVEDLLNEETLASIRAEYAGVMNRLYLGWFEEGLVKDPPEGLDFWEKLDRAFRGGFDWYQPFDISLPHDGITTETPMHFGPAVF